MKKYANVIIEISALSLDRPFTYLIPEHLKEYIEIGSIVTILFGATNRELKGYVVDILDAIDFEENKLKEIQAVNQGVNIESTLIKLAYWMKKRYLCSIQSALKSMIPSSKELKKKYKRIIEANIECSEIKKILNETKDSRLAKRNKVLSTLLINKSISEKELIVSAGISKAVINTMEKKGLIKVVQSETYRNPFEQEKINPTQRLIPNYQQQKAIYSITQAVREESSDIFLLHGITGSGKTEVYMQVIQQVIDEGKQAIVLIPEIALTPQTVNRFVGRFGELVGVLHSKLSQGEKYDQWRKAKEGKIKIMVGPRSAVFAPFENLGVIIIDEEHEMTYKSEMPPKYHAREVAIKRGDMAKCPIILGSATPLIETYYKAKTGKYKLLELGQKAIESAQLNVEIVDMRNELSNGNKTMLSFELKKEIEAALQRKEQVILFLNRRGHSSFVSCRKCGYVVKCSSCDIPFTYHSNNERLICHYCGKSIKKITTCPNCHSKYIKEFGIGTQKVENYIKGIFPDAKILRMDFDTTAKKHGHEEIIEDFKTHKADILIGTQMVAKGHHFENVTVVGVIAADMSLYIDDFRACERTFQLVTQVTGRTGRGLKKGKAIIQTYTPEHYSLVSAKAQDYLMFYENEIKFRQMMGYPPFSNIGVILMSAEDEKELIKNANRINEIIHEEIGNNKVIVLGPTPANITKIKNSFRWRIILKCEEYKLVNHLLQVLNNRIYQENITQSITVQLDINPMMSY